jgi:hypothetical protein
MCGTRLAGGIGKEKGMREMGASIKELKLREFGILVHGCN